MREVWREKGHPPKGGPFSLQASLILPELPPRVPALAERKFGSLCFLRVLLGEVFVVLGGADRKKSAVIALFGVDFFSGKG